ncbi:MAG: elongation factor P 5-aminopentanone reductase [Oscillospiraceae bacterium]|jgi:3-oxoacyl-[acyl-carrier protein] reductase
MMKQTVLITGASRGIGRAAARLFAQAGYQVAVNYHKSEQAALELVSELTAQGYSASAFHADVSKRNDVFEMVDKVLLSYKQIDILICNAGIANYGLVTEFTEEDWRSIFAVNVDGVFHACQAVLPGMIHRKSGKIITVSSIWGMSGASCEAAYSASKAAVIGMTQSLAKELGPSGICVNCVAPGATQTDMIAGFDAEALDGFRLETPLERLGKPEDIAQTYLFLASSAADFITGQVLSPNGGYLI